MKTILALIVCLMLCSSLFAESSATNDLVGSQKQIRNQTERATADLNALILEFDRNGLGGGADVMLLKGIQKALNNLTEKDMQEVIAILESIHKGGGNLADTLQKAFDKQKGISTQLQAIIIQYMHEQDLADVALRLTRLADRENQNMRAGTNLYRTTKGASPKTYNEIQKAQVQVQQSEQQAIYAEAKVLLERLVTLAKSADPTTADHLNAVIAGAQKGKLEAILAGAADDLHSSNLFSAVGKQRVARDLLRDLARLVAPAKEPEDVLKDAAATLAQAIRDENYIAQQAKTVTPENKDSTDTIAQLDDRSADSLDIAASVRKDILNIIPDAVSDLNKAADSIQNSRKNLSDANGKEASDLATDAARKLNDARKKILDQLARIEEQKRADTKIAKEKALLDQITALRIAQETLKTDTGGGGGVKNSDALADLAARQSALAKNCHDLQVLALSDTPIVAPNLETAAKSMDDAGVPLAAQKPQDAAKPQQIAIDELKKAEAILAQDIASLEKKAQDLAKLSKARDEVAKMIKDQAKVEQETNKLSANDNKPKEDDPTPQELAKAQDQIAKQADQTSKDIADTASNASQNLQDATKNADAATSDLNKPDTQAANQQERQAQSNLDKAKSDLDKQIAQLQQDLGETGDDAAKLADAMNKIDQAQSDMSNSKLADAGDQAAAAKADNSSALPADAQKALSDAQQALSDANAAKDAGKPDNGAIDKAKDALAKAKTSVAMAQAGLAANQDQNQGKGPPDPNKPNDQPGKVDENTAKTAKDSKRTDNTVSADSQTGPNAVTHTHSGFAGLPARDRDAIQQSRAEKYPEEYGPMIEQYLKNLSDQNNK
ncbi:MAG: hypothetical protein FWD61_13080 [Phycisphaerales bacterium]|nr:hypothetical protein [Phycisphaerales bacterium]